MREDGVSPATSGVTMRHLLEQAVSNTSMHGLPKVAKSASMTRSVAWTAILTLGSVLLVWQVSEGFRKHLSFPVETSVSVEIRGNLPVPAITICNMNSMKMSTLSLLLSQKELHDWHDKNSKNQGDDEELPESANGSSHALKHDQKASLAADPTSNEEAYLNEGTSAQEMIDKLITSRWDKSLSEQISMGHSLKDMLIQCTWNCFETCDASNFSLYLTSFNGNCYTFNTFKDEETISEVDKSKMKMTSRTGPLYGLSLVLYVEQFEYIPSSYMAGVTLLIHNQTAPPMPDQEGYSVPTGQLTNIALKRTESIDAPPPYGRCGERDPTTEYPPYMLASSRRYLTYNQKACRMVCYQWHVGSICQCSDPFYQEYETAFYNQTSLDPQTVPCTSLEQMGCSIEVFDDFSHNRLNCSETCPDNCYDVKHTATISTATWPSDIYQAALIRDAKRKNLALKKKLNALSDVQETDKFIRKDFLAVNVFFEDTSVAVTKTQASYTLSELLGDIGGLMGLYIGLSVITVFEFVELLLDICSLCVARKVKNNNNASPPPTHSITPVK